LDRRTRSPAAELIAMIRPDPWARILSPSSTPTEIAAV
jgi:hypothetical protein